ncbi:cationic peptide response regulator transcription factor CprR [Pseudomonas aeruginosa]|uniref:cationic peptide response regulator transcription factor CprR n=1 Tax=Pseudomonas aeruginosa TaxID=287 RepID=UPI00383AAD88
MHIHVLVVEDNFDLAGTVIDYLEAAGVACDHARDGQAGLNLARANRYDVILLDIMLPRINGRQVCRQLREAGLQTPVLMLTALDTLQDKLDGFDAGADDYLLKPFELPELLVRLQALSRRRSGQAQRLQVDDLVMDLDSRQASRGGTPLALSPTAWKILECLMRASPALVTREQLGRSVWGDDPPESNTLNVHMHHLRSTVDKGFATPLIHTLHSVGFQLERK